MPTPVALTIAGSDCSAGAGLQADLKTFSALGVYGLTAVTCVVAEVPGKVARIAAVEPANVREQIELLLANFPVAAVKTGLLYSTEIVELVAEVFAERVAQKIPLVIDPVMVATSGDRLLEPGAVEIYQSRLFPLATLVTPNMAEAAALTNRPVTNLAEMRTAGQFLQEKHGTPFLIKGGHLDGARAIDLLCDGAEVKESSAPFVPGVATHALEATLASIGLARGDSLGEAIARGKEFVSRALAGHFTWPSSLGDIHALRHF